MIKARITDFSVVFDRDHYCKQRTIFAHLQENYGDSWGADFTSKTTRWTCHQIFGYTTIKFVNRADYFQFKKWVRKNRDKLVYHEGDEFL